MERSTILILLVTFCFLSNAQSPSYKQIPATFQGKHHMLSPDELLKENFNLKNFEATDPPPGLVRSIAEFEPNQGVIIRAGTYYGQIYFGITYHFIATMSEHVIVYVICKDSEEEDLVTTAFLNADVNINNVEFVYAPSDGFWTRDYSPWFIEYDDKSVGIVNFPYNRPRPADDSIPGVMGEYFDMEVFGMPLIHTGGNYMTDGMGVAASCDLVYEENSDLSAQEIAELAENFLGINNYYLVNDPLDSYIQHIDCWGKFLAPDKILITEVPYDDPRYDDFEAMADFWANQISSYGNKYKVYRTYSPNGQPFSNSLILNNRVYVPIISDEAPQYNEDALLVYQEAMPGYEIIGVEEHSYFSWQSSDALHCRTSQVTDFEMLRIVHYPFLDSINFEDSYMFEAEVYSLSSTQNMEEEVYLYYQINGSEFQQVEMNNISETNYAVEILEFTNEDSVCYYIQATNNNNKTEKHPYIGEYSPHCFIIIDDEVGSVKISDNSYIKAFPNPVYDRLTITANDLPNDNYLLQIIDNKGRILKEKNLEVQNSWIMLRVDMSGFEQGLYFVRIIGNNNSFSERFIKL